MTSDEREREAQRLIAILQGHGDAALIGETGGIEDPPEPEDTRSCQLCSAWMDAGEGCEIDGDCFCEDCAPEAEMLSRLQVTCVICRGKGLCLRRVDPSDLTAKSQWLPCVMCHGKGWIDGILARLNGLL
jgi:hypothetical protein